MPPDSNIPPAPPVDQRHRWLAIVCLLVAMVGFAATNSCNRWLLKGTPLAGEPWPGQSLTSFRYAIAALILLPWVVLIIRRRRELWRQDWPRIILLALAGVVLYYPLSNSALSYASASMNAVLGQTSPLLGFLGGLIFLGERLTVLKVAGLAVALAGGVAFSLSESNASPVAGDNVALAAALVFAASLCWAVYLVTVKKIAHRWSGLEIGVLVAGLGGVLVTAFGELLGLASRLGLAAQLGLPAVEVHWSLLRQFTPQAWLVLAYLIVGAGIICYSLYNFSLKYLEASRVAVASYLIVPFAMLIATQLPGDLRETPTPQKLAAAALTILGVWLVTWRRKGRD